MTDSVNNDGLIARPVTLSIKIIIDFFRFASLIRTLCIDVDDEWTSAADEPYYVDPAQNDPSTASFHAVGLADFTVLSFRIRLSRRNRNHGTVRVASASFKLI